MNATLVFHLAKKIFSILMLCGLVAGTFYGSSLPPVHAKVPPEDTGEVTAEATPWFVVWLNQDGSISDITGYGWPMDATVTMTLDDPSTPVSPDFTRVANTKDPWDFDESGISVKPGDVVTMSDGTTNLTHTITSLHVTEVNPDTDIVGGTAVPFSEVRVSGDPGESWPGSRNVVAAANGSWMADFSKTGPNPGEAKADIYPGLTVISTQGNGGGATVIVWIVPNDQGIITGIVHDLSDTPITGVAIDVTATYTNGTLSTCTNPATGTYQIEGLPLNDPITVSANANGGCDNNNFGWEFWQHVTVQAPTPITLTDSTRVASGINFTLGSIPWGIEYFFFNLNTPALSDKAVRTAIAYGTDRQRMLDQAWRPAGITGTVQNSYLPDDQWGHAPNSALTLYHYDPDLARSTLATAGWIDSDQDGVREKNGQELSFSFKTTWLQARQENGALFVADMQAIGIQINPSYLEPNLLLGHPNGALWKGDFEIAEAGFFQCGSREDTTCVPYSMFVTGDSGNAMSYSSMVADSLYANAQAASTLDLKLFYVIQHQAIISQDLPVLPLFKKIPGYLTCLPLVIR